MVISLVPSSPAVCLFGKARHDEGQHLTFARRESLVATLQLHSLRSFQPFCSIEADCHIDRAQQFFVAEGLRQELDGARLHGLY